jgi:transcriptional regulator with XRE-family HTH domain
MRAPTPQQIRDRFGKNLRILVSGEPSVSQVCRDIGVNRTQFLRYLSGEAHPRPDVLHRICKHFGVDARILLEPIETLREEDDPGPHPALGFPAFLSRMRDFDHGVMPDGFYRLLRPTFTVPDMVSASMIALSTLPDGSSLARTAIDSVHFGGKHQRLSWRQRRARSLAFQNTVGTAFLFLTTTVRPAMYLSYFTHGHDADNQLFFGYTAMMRSNEQHHALILPSILERVGSRLRDGIAARRRCGVYSWDRLMETERLFFEDWNPFGPFTPRWIKGIY